MNTDAQTPVQRRLGKERQPMERSHPGTQASVPVGCTVINKVTVKSGIEIK